MELPEDVLQIIRTYAKPVTRPDWRTLHIMPQEVFLYECFLQATYRWNRINSGNYKVIFGLWWYRYMYIPTINRNIYHQYIIDTY